MPRKKTLCPSPAPGSTPAGDDLLAGRLVALHALGEVDAAAALAAELPLDRTTTLSAELLRRAAVGEASRPVIELLRALDESTRREQQNRRLWRDRYRAQLDLVAELAAELDFIGVHTYLEWEGKTIDEGLSYTIENIEAVRAALPNAPIAILEAGWATVAIEFGERANEADQLRYYREMKAWAEETNTTLFWFEAFDEPWKGDENDPHGAEKHWGLFFVDRTPKLVFRDRQAPGK